MLAVAIYLDARFRRRRRLPSQILFLIGIRHDSPEVSKGSPSCHRHLSIHLFILLTEKSRGKWHGARDLQSNTIRRHGAHADDVFQGCYLLLVLRVPVVEGERCYRTSPPPGVSRYGTSTVRADTTPVVAMMSRCRRTRRCRVRYCTNEYRTRRLRYAAYICVPYENQAAADRCMALMCAGG